MICTWILKNRVWKIQFDELDFLSISNDFYCLCSLQKSGLKQTKNPVCRTWFFKLDFSKIKCRTIGGVQAKFTAVVENISYSTQVYGNFIYYMTMGSLSWQVSWNLFNKYSTFKFCQLVDDMPRTLNKSFELVLHFSSIFVYKDEAGLYHKVIQKRLDTIKVLSPDVSWVNVLHVMD